MGLKNKNKMKYKVNRIKLKLKFKRPKISKRAKWIKASYNTWKEWKQDKIGYWLFRVNKKKKRIEAGFCRKDNLIEVIVYGKDSEAMYNTIRRERLVTKLQHAAYIGHELQKAEVALKLGIPYVQDKPLQFHLMKYYNKKIKKKLKRKIK